MPPILSWAQEVLPPPVVGVFVQHPVALHDIGRGDVTGVETLVQIWAVLHQLQVLASKVGPLKNLHPVVPSVLREKHLD